jgi:uncharacterized protein with ParB-like and HNH nuclease domain
MKANETTFQHVIEGTKQYIVPLFQRPYCWDKAQWETLWNDLVDMQDVGCPRSHFIGSIVTLQTQSVPEGVPKFLLIDGQQRLTTTFILLTLLRDTARREGRVELADEIEQTLLVNRFKKGDDHVKLLPTQSDRPAFLQLVQNPGTVSSGRIGAAYSFLDRKLRSAGIDVEALKGIIVERLAVVSIMLGSEDNPYLVFESLNAKGERLTQADLIRNFFFLKIHTDHQEDMHTKYWLPMQEALGEQLTEFIRHYLIGQDGSFLRGDSVYFRLKERLGGGDAVELLQTLHRAALNYERLLSPKVEPERELSESLAALGRLDVTTVYPFLLRCYDDLVSGRLSADEFSSVVHVIENYVVRRFVCFIPTNQFNKIFPGLYNQIRREAHSSILAGVKSILSGRGYPKDVEFRKALVENGLYGSGDRQAKIRFILERIERHLAGKEPPRLETVSVEHVMPQTLTVFWRDHLGEDWETAHALWLHTLGNLTLTGYNSEMSNDDFSAKRQRLVDGTLHLNKLFSKFDSWRAADIRARAETLVEPVLSIWPYFGADQPQELVSPPRGRRPTELRILGKTCAVSTWRDVLENTVNEVVEIDPDAFGALSRELSSHVGGDRTRFREARQLRNGGYVNVNLSAEGIDRLCRRILDVAGVSESEWNVETR